VQYKRETTVKFVKLFGFGQRTSRLLLRQIAGRLSADRFQKDEILIVEIATRARPGQQNEPEKPAAVSRGTATSPSAIDFRTASPASGGRAPI